MLVRLLYASRAKEPLTPEVIDAILQASRKGNPAAGVTGLLCHSGDVFMQVLEGGRDTVNHLYNDLVRDARHHDVVVLHYEEITERRFSGWTMGQVNLARINPAIVLKYSDRPVLDPFSVSGAASLSMLEELIATASIVGRTA